MEENKLTVVEAAEIMGVTQSFLREALIRDKFPFGTGITMSEGERRTFYINRKRFEKWMEGDDPECSL